MPSQRITLTDPETGKPIVLDWTGSAPPTPQDEAAIYAEAKAMRQQPLKVNLANPTGAVNMTGGDPGEYVSNDDLWKLGGNLLELGAGGAAGVATGGMSIPAQLGIGAATDALAGGVGGWMKGADPIKEAVGNSALGLAFGGAAAAASPIANRLAQLFGGKFKNIGEDADAFVRYRQKAHSMGQRGIPVGGRDATKTAMGEWGQRVKHAELNNPATLSIQKTLSGSQDDLLSRATDSVFPLDETAGIEKRLQEHIAQQQRARGGFVRDPDNILDISGEVVEPTALSTAVRRRTPGPVRNVKDAEIVDDVIDIHGQGSTFTPRDEISVREAGNLKRAASERSDDVIRARKRGEMIPASEKASSQFDANLGNAWRRAQKEVDTTGEISAANSVLSDLKKMDKTNEAIRNPWSPGAITARAAVGGGAASALSAATGMPFLEVLPILSGIMAGASPTNISRAGYLADTLGSAAPHLIRGAQVVESTDAIMKKDRKVKRREPK